MKTVKPFRFGTVFHGFASELGDSGSPPEQAIREVARKAEKIGYSTFSFNDHIKTRFSPLIAAQAVADSTTTLRISQHVLNQDFRHPALLAKDLATLDVMSGGRTQVGIGAGWLREEYEQIGIPYDKPSVRIERLEEIVIILKGLFTNEPFSFSGKYFTIKDLKGGPKPKQPGGPPIKIAGGGKKILSVAARHADIIEVMDRPFSKEGIMTVTGEDNRGAEPYEDRIAWIKEAAGNRFGEIELAISLMSFAITDDAEQAVEKYIQERRWSVERFGGAVSSNEVSFEKVMASPRSAIGTLDETCDKLLAIRAKFGFNYFLTPFGTPMEEMAPVIERLSGT